MDNITEQDSIPTFVATNTAVLTSIPPKPSPKVELINTVAPMPFLRAKPANCFRQLRKLVLDKTGRDYLSVCADVMRDKNFASNKPGVAKRSRHKAADAVDFDQSVNYLIVVSEPQGLQQFFRIWLKCVKQDGTQGVKVTLKDIRKYTVQGWYFDFTAEAERIGWQRIPAWQGWSTTGSGYTKMEFWHYQMTEGLSWDEAMRFLYDPTVHAISDVRLPPAYRVLGPNDRGAAVRNLQDKLTKLKDVEGHPYLSRDQVDGVYGKVTQTAIIRLQERYGLDTDGLVGPHTRELIERLLQKVL